MRTKQQLRSGKILTVSSVAGTAPSSDDGHAHFGDSKSRYRLLHAVFGAGSRAIRHRGKLYRSRCDRDRGDHGDGLFRAALRATVIGPSWSPYWRLGTVEGGAKVVEFLATNRFGYMTGAWSR